MTQDFFLNCLIPKTGIPDVVKQVATLLIKFCRHCWVRLNGLTAHKALRIGLISGGTPRAALLEE